LIEEKVEDENKNKLTKIHYVSITNLNGLFRNKKTNHTSYCCDKLKG
jgi:hypothetical protein